MTPEFDIALDAAKEAYKAWHAHLRACKVCVPWGWGPVGCRVGLRLWRDQHNAIEKAEALVRLAVSGDDPVKYPDNDEGVPDHVYGVEDGTLPRGSPGYWSSWYLEKCAKAGVEPNETERAPDAPPPPPTMAERRAALKAKITANSSKLSALRTEQAKLRREDFDARGWKSCCRCYPNAVGDDGFCGCCYYSHKDGKTLFADPDPFDSPPDSSEPTPE